MRRPSPRSTYGAVVSHLASTDPTEPGRRGYRRAVLAGLLPAAAVYVALLAGGRRSLVYHEQASGFYGEQARAWLAGRWDVSPGVLGPEAIIRDGDAYGYFGPFPALLRVPFMLIDVELQGRLGGLSLLLASVVFAGACARLLWLVGPWRGAGAVLRRTDAALVALWSATLIAGTTWLFLASRTFMYHESIAWGVALTVTGATILLSNLRAWSRPRVALLFLVLLGAIHARAATASGLIVAVAAVAASMVLRNDRRRGGALIAGLVVVVASYAGVNAVKFGHPIAVPWQLHTGIATDPERLERLEDFGLFGFRYIPTTIFQYLRPDAVGYLDVAPWISFPNQQPALFRDVPFDGIEQSSSIPSSMPAIAVLSVAGVAAVARRRKSVAGALVVVPLFVGWLPTMASAGITHRYLADLLPPLVVSSAFGVAWLVRWTDRWMRWAVVVIGTLALWSIAANASLGLLYQRAYSNSINPEVKARFAWAQSELRATVGGRFQVLRVALGDPLPRMKAGQFAVVGDCAGLYLYNGREVVPVQRSAATGVLRLEVTFVPQPPGTREPLLSVGRYEAADLLIVEHLAPGRAVLAFDHWGSPLSKGPTFSFAPSEPTTLEIQFDPIIGEARVRGVAGELLSVAAPFYPYSGYPLLLGKNEVSPTVSDQFAGLITPLHTRAERRCSALVPEDRAPDHAPKR